MRNGLSSVLVIVTQNTSAQSKHEEDRWKLENCEGWDGMFEQEEENVSP